MSSPIDTIHTLAERCIAGWCAHDPAAVAAVFEPTGVMSINGAPPLAGRAAIAEMVAGFCADFPDLVLHLDGCRAAGNSAIYLWTFDGTHAATGNQVHFSGWEAWTLSGNILVHRSSGRYDADDYERQLAAIVG